MTPQLVSQSRIGVTNYEPFLVDGKPFGEVHWLRTTPSKGTTLYAGLWRHPAGQFDYVFPDDETFHVLEGRVRIALHGGPTLELVPGDIVSFVKGAPSTWTIHEPMKKFFVISG